MPHQTLAQSSSDLATSQASDLRLTPPLQEIEQIFAAPALRPVLQVVQIAALAGGMRLGQKAVERRIKKDAAWARGFDRIVKDIVGVVYPSRQTGKIYFDPSDPHNAARAGDIEKLKLLRVDVADALAFLIGRYRVEEVPNLIRRLHDYHVGARALRPPINQIGKPIESEATLTAEALPQHRKSYKSPKKQDAAITTKHDRNLLFLFYMMVETEDGWFGGTTLQKEAVLKGLQGRIEAFNVSRYGLKSERIEKWLDLAQHEFPKRL